MASDRIQRRIEQLLNAADPAVSQFDWALVRANAEAVLACDLENTGAKAYLKTAQRATDHSSIPPVSTPQRPGESTPATTSPQPHLLGQRPLPGQAVPGRRRKEEGLPDPRHFLDREVPVDRI